MLTGADAAGMDAVIGAWLAEQALAAAAGVGVEPEAPAIPVAIAVVGKTLRGACHMVCVRAAVQI